jgi:cob(I)alamin adenosyltransferase
MEKCHKCTSNFCLIKSSTVANAIGDIDELIAHISVYLTWYDGECALTPQLCEFQNELKIISSELLNLASEKLEVKYYKKLEHYIEKIEQEIEYPKGWYDGADNTKSAELNLIRTIVRRCERVVSKYNEEHSISNKVILAYLNKLSTWFYLASLLNSHYRKE